MSPPCRGGARGGGRDENRGGGEVETLNAQS